MALRRRLGVELEQDWLHLVCSSQPVLLRRAQDLQEVRVLARRTLVWKRGGRSRCRVYQTGRRLRVRTIVSLDVRQFRRGRWPRRRIIRMRMRRRIHRRVGPWRSQSALRKEHVLITHDFWAVILQLELLAEYVYN